MRLSKHSPSSSLSRNYSPSSSSRERSSGGGFHPFGGRVSRHFGDSLSPDDAYLSYHDIRLTREDVRCLRSDWLTDNCIAFWEEYLERTKLIHYPSSHIILLRPSMTFLLLKTNDPLSLKSALPDFGPVSGTTHVFLPINDCGSVDVAEGGSHWSLLLVSILDGVAFHYDSLSPSHNYHEARSATHRLSTLLGRPLRFINLDDSPQQENSMDCGVYVCSVMQYLLIQKLLRAGAEQKMSMSMRNMEVDASGMRKAMLRVVEELRVEGERRRSRSGSPAVGGNHSASHLSEESGKRRSGSSRWRDKSKSRSPPRVGEENAVSAASVGDGGTRVQWG